MRDLGTMGESTFSLWCANAGLIANGSKIDKTGWDFYVEFPVSDEKTLFSIHDSSLECKVQVKATDKTEKKVQITLSNLKRLVTAPIPCFFTFLEFNGESEVKKAYVRHVDSDLIFKVLRRIHELEQSKKDNNFNKRKMTIKYDDSHSITPLNAHGLKREFEKYIGADFSKYIERKRECLRRVGFEDGLACMEFTTKGSEDFEALADVSLGLQERVDIVGMKTVLSRFGINVKKPLLEFDKCQLSIDNLKPSSTGIIKFRENKFSLAYIFNVNLYTSPAVLFASKESARFRLKGKFFDMIIAPFESKINLSFLHENNLRLSIEEFRSALEVLKLISLKNKSLFVTIELESLPKIEFHINSVEKTFAYAEELEGIKSALRIVSDFGVSNVINISLEEIYKEAVNICQFEKILNSEAKQLYIDFPVEDDKNFNWDIDYAAIVLQQVQVGSHKVSVIMTLVGKVIEKEEKLLSICPDRVVVEKKMIMEKGEVIEPEDIDSLIKAIAKKYENLYQIISMMNT